MPASKQHLTASPCHIVEELGLQLPFWRYYEILKGQPYSFLLDSAMDPEKLGKYSFLGGDPFLVFRAKRRRSKLPLAPASIELHRFAPPVDDTPPRLIETVRRVGDPFEELRRLLTRYRVEREHYSDHPVPFLSGAVGYFGYEAGYFLESLPDLGKDDLRLPEMSFLFTDSLLAHCNQTGRSYLSIVGRGPTNLAARNEAARMRDLWLRRIESFEADPAPEWVAPTASTARKTRAAPLDVHAHFDGPAYGKAVNEVKEQIFAGNAYEVCLTHRLDAAFSGEAWNLYQELRRINPAPFAAFLNAPDAQVVSSSPERFLRLGPDRFAESRPIKGTRPRASSRRQDEKLRRELTSSIKDRAENMMIVDLVRNDFGKVAKFGTVSVPELMIVEQYATVHQMVSTVQGELRPDVDGIDLIKASFPGGSMTGAPKIEAMKIIDQIEPVKRGIYSGAIGYLDFSGTLDLNIVIRSVIVKDGRCYFNVGGAIVADSDPLDEYQETMDKARALITAISNLQQRTGS